MSSWTSVTTGLNDSTLPTPVSLDVETLPGIIATDQTPGPKAALIGGAIGGVVSGLGLITFLFWFIHRIRRHPGRSPSSDPSPSLPRSRPVTPASSRPVSVFSDTTIDSQEDHRKRPRRKLTRRGSNGTSLRSVRMRELGHVDGGSTVSILTSPRKEERNWVQDEDLTGTTIVSTSGASTTVSTVPLIRPQPTYSPPRHAAYTIHQPIPISPSRSIPQPIQPQHSQHVQPMGGGYAGAISRAATYNVDYASQQPVQIHMQNNQSARRIAAEVYEERY